MIVPFLNLQFLEIEHEVYILEDYNNLVDSQITHAIEQQKQKYKEILANKNDEIDKDIVRGEYWRMVDDVIGRLFRYPSVLMAWSVYERAIHGVALYLKNFLKKELFPRDIKGSDEFDRYIKYYRYILNFELFTSDAKEELNRLRLIRNFISHYNGCVELAENNKLQKIREIAAVDSRININIQYLEVSKEYLDGSVLLVKNEIINLICRVVKDPSLEKIF